ncbi:DNA-processing protein DprA [Siccirubricoccus deserti]|nr:DNA-processing protein DprA [Siccirubricoccus deserti]
MEMEVGTMAPGKGRGRPRSAPRRYTAPDGAIETTVGHLLALSGRFDTDRARMTLDLFKGDGGPDGSRLYCAGDLELLRQRCVAIVGTRQISDDGRARAAKLARLVVGAGAVVVSGLAFGVDTVAHSTALAADGRTIAVVGTPLDRCNPMQNAPLQEEIYREHLLISQFAWGSEVYPSNFPKRNRLMAALCDVTVIVEASDTSGTLHQAAECVRLKRHLFILRSVVEDARLLWPHKFLGHPTVHVLEQPGDLLSVLR